MLIAPDRVTDQPQPWQGVTERKPWEYAVQVVIPHLDTPERSGRKRSRVFLTHSKTLLRLQRLNWCNNA
jgi:hypothetical protein